VQYQLLKMGIDSARMTTDAGVDLVVYAPGDRSASTVQVKANMSAKPSGGRGPLSRGWYFPDQCPAQYLAFVALDTDTAWLFTLKESRSWPSNILSEAFVSCTGVSRPFRLEPNRRVMRHRWSTTSSQREPRSCSPSKRVCLARGKCGRWFGTVYPCVGVSSMIPASKTRRPASPFKVVLQICWKLLLTR
jgi:hypothetical protein